MVPTSSRSSSPAHPSPPSAPAATVRPRRLPRAVVGGALTAGLAVASLGVLVGADALTAPSAAAQVAPHAVPANYATSVIAITSVAADRADTEVVVTTPGGSRLTITRPYRSTPYVTIDDRTTSYVGGTDTEDAQLVWDQWSDTWRLTPHRSGTFIVQASASSTRANSGERPVPHVKLNGTDIDDSPIALIYPARR